MDTAKVFKDYFVSSQNAVLIPNDEFGKRKFINLGINRSMSLSRLEEITLHHTDEMTSGTKQWIHPSESLIQGQVMYIVKFYGECEVAASKGTDLVKDAIRKRKLVLHSLYLEERQSRENSVFNKSLWKTEGQRTPKVELLMCIDGVTIQDRKTKVIMHQYPLHRISYCANDKSDRRMFTFIAKAIQSNKHFCYVFDSDRNAEEITLTLGQAFDLAYKRFLETQGKDMDVKKQQISLQTKLDTLVKENEQLKSQIRELEMLKDGTDIANYKHSKQITDLTEVTPASASTTITLQYIGGKSNQYPDTSQSVSSKLPSMGKKLENVLIESSTTLHGTTTSSTAQSSQGPVCMISPPPPSGRSRKSVNLSNSTTQSWQHSSYQSDMIDELATVLMSSSGVSTTGTLTAGAPTAGASTAGAPTAGAPTAVFSPFITPQESADPFGMPTFTPAQKSTLDFRFQGSKTDQDFLDLAAGFSEGLSFGTEDFGLDSFDPRRQSTYN